MDPYWLAKVAYATARHVANQQEQPTGYRRPEFAALPPAEQQGWLTACAAAVQESVRQQWDNPTTNRTRESWAVAKLEALWAEGRLKAQLTGLAPGQGEQCWRCGEQRAVGEVVYRTTYVVVVAKLCEGCIAKWCNAAVLTEANDAAQTAT